MVTILLKLFSRSELVVKGVGDIFKPSDGVLWEQIEPMLSGSLEAGSMVHSRGLGRRLGGH